MLKIYQGRYKDGKLILPERERALMPDNVNVVIAVLDDDMVLSAHAGIDASDDGTAAQDQREAFERFFSAIDAIDGEPITDEDLADFAQNRVNFRRKL